MVEAAATTDAAVAMLAARRFDLWLVDWRLDKDGTRGTDLVRRLRQSGASTPFILYSGHLTTPITVEAMKLGAYTVLERLTDSNRFLQAIAEALEPAASAHRQPSASTPTERRPQPAAAALADWIVQALQFNGDLKTLAGLGKFIGISERRFRNACAQAGIDSLEARDFGRSLSAVIWSAREQCEPVSLLQGDTQTLVALCSRAGLVTNVGQQITVEQFLVRQHFVPTNHELLRAVRARLAKDTAS